MRLTLRTLLAYLDDVLDPNDKEQLAQKIESSDFAKDLVHQTRDSVRRLRLSAPQVIGTGMAMDPNTVAEYLDNALPPEQVGDYERICLESDVHLAETAACHHVLTMVLGEPAEVEPRSRQRMYMIPAEARERRRLRAEPAHARVPGSTPAPAPAAALANTVAVVQPGSMRQTAAAPNAYEIPEYLRTRPWWQSYGALGAVAVLLVVGLATYFIADSMGLVGGAQEVAAVDIDAQDEKQEADIIPPLAVEAPNTEVAPEQPANAETVEVDPSVASTTTDTTAPAASAEAATATTETETMPPPAAPQLVTPNLVPPPATTNGNQAAVETPVAPAGPTLEPGATVDTDQVPSTTPLQATTDDASATPTPDATAPPAASTDSSSPAAPVPPQTGEVPPVDANTTPPQANLTPTTPSDAAPVDQPPAEAVAAAGNPALPPPDGASAVVEGAAADASAAAVDPNAAPPGPVELGTYLSGKTVLLRHDDAKGGWFRVEPRSAVVAGERLLALPEFRPKITLAAGLSLDLSGGTQIVMHAGDAENGAAIDAAAVAVPLIEILYGRLVLINTSNEDNSVRIKAGNTVGEARLAKNSTLAVEVDRPYVAGNDPRTTPSPVIMELFVPEGGVAWKDSTGEVVADKATRWRLMEGAAPEVVADTTPPDWIDQEPVVHLSEQRFGAPVVEGAITSDRPVDIQLLELFKGRDRREVKSLVTRSAIHVDLIAPFIDTLRDPEQKWPAWRTQIETLRAAMARSPESAELVFKTLVDQRGRAPAADLYEMLCGYNAEQIGTTPDQVKTGALSRLIDWLEEDSLDYRVLAVHDLWEITGKQLMPNPAANSTVRKQNVRRWRERLQSGELEPAARSEG